MELELEFGSQHVTGLRIFEFNRRDITLQSITGELWIPGEIKESKCTHLRGYHPELKVLPTANCTCGIWSCKTRNDLWRTGYGSIYGCRLVAARVEQWGVVVEHQSGYRSEFARLLPDTLHWWPRNGNHKNIKLLKFLKEKYDPRPV